MAIERVIVKNYRALRNADVSFGENMNIIVGDNETGKSTLLEAINLALRCQINRRPALYELHPFLINADATSEFVNDRKAGKPVPPPEVLIELYFKDTPTVADLRGSNNSRKVDSPGISLAIKLDENVSEEFASYVSDPQAINGIPIEYYKVEWLSFANELLSAKAVPLKTTLIDPDSISNSYSAHKYVLEIIRNYLDKSQSANLAIAYRGMRDEFQKDARVVAINAELSSKKGKVSDKVLSVAMDTTTRASWETGVLPHLNDIPLTLVGKGEQNSIKIKLAIEAADACDIFLLEEPENHLSHTNLGKLVNHLATQSTGKQFIVSTHSSFVLNKLGIENVIMFDGKKGVTIGDLSASTKSYFQRLPGHDTLRMILAGRSILVEGPSDELIVQKGFRQKHGKLPLEFGVEVISVGTSFKRFLDIALLLDLDVAVVRDNDGDHAAKMALFAEYASAANIRIYIDADNNARTLEPQLVKVNEFAKLNMMIGKTFETEADLTKYMTENKTACALALFEHPDDLEIPQYVRDAIG